MSKILITSLSLLVPCFSLHWTNIQQPKSSSQVSEDNSGPHHENRRVGLKLTLAFRTRQKDWDQLTCCKEMKVQIRRQSSQASQLGFLKFWISKLFGQSFVDLYLNSSMIGKVLVCVTLHLLLKNKLIPMAFETLSQLIEMQLD